jgi:cytoskeletal protein CcmA (bactofilin family)
MQDREVGRDSTERLGQVDGNLRIGNRARIEAADGNLVVVSKGVYLEGGATLDCNLECESLQVEHGGTLTVNGDLTVHKLLDVVHSINSSGLIKAGEIDVGGKIRVKSIVCEGRIRVGGVLEVERDLEAKLVDVGGKSTIGGKVKLQDLEVGGLAVVNGGSISGKIRVGGKFESKSKIEFGDLEALGRISLPAHSSGNRISTYGKVTTSGDIECKLIEVNGMMQIDGNCKSEKVRTHGKLEVAGELEASDQLETFGATEILGDFRGANLRAGGKFRAKRAVVSSRIDIAGDVETKEGMKGDSVLVSSGSRCSGPLVAREIEVGKSYSTFASFSKEWIGQSMGYRLIGRETRVEDLYAKEVRLGHASRSRKIFAEVVKYEEGCIMDELTYTKELLGDYKKSYFVHPPSKVTELPTPPV